jgi:UDP-glucuronate 4-epimerase
VRYSLENPHAYVDSNLIGFVNMLELVPASRRRTPGVCEFVVGVRRFGDAAVFRSAAHRPPALALRRDQGRERTDGPHLRAPLRLRATGLRFFTVYGPWGRPDMAPLLFSRAVLAGRPIQVFNHGRMRRDFTYIDDIVAGVLGAMDAPARPAGENAAEGGPHRVYNLGNHTPVGAGALHHRDRAGRPGRPAEKKYLPMQPGDMVETMADTARAHADFGFEPATPIDTGLPPVVRWCREYFGDKA